MKYPVAQFTDAEVAEATEGLGATKLKPRKAKPTAMRVKGTKGVVRSTGGLSTGYPRKVFI